MSTCLACTFAVPGKLQLALQGRGRLLRQADLAEQPRQRRVARTRLRDDLGRALRLAFAKLFFLDAGDVLLQRVDGFVGAFQALLVELGQLEGLAPHFRAFQAGVAGERASFEHGGQFRPARSAAVDVLQAFQRLGIARLQHDDGAIALFRQFNLAELFSDLGHAQIERDDIGPRPALHCPQIDGAHLVPAILAPGQTLHLGTDGFVAGVEDKGAFQGIECAIHVVGTAHPDVGHFHEVAMPGDHVGAQKLVGLHPFLPRVFKAGGHDRHHRHHRVRHRLWRRRFLENVDIENVDLARDLFGL